MPMLLASKLQRLKRRLGPITVFIAPPPQLRAALLYAMHWENPIFTAIDCPENGTHPEQFEDWVRSLREEVAQGLSSLGRVIITYSPYLVDLFRPKELFISCIDDDGEVVWKRMSQVRNIDKLLNAFQPGELWGSTTEEELIFQPNDPVKK